MALYLSKYGDIKIWNIREKDPCNVFRLIVLRIKESTKLLAVRAIILPCLGIGIPCLSTMEADILTNTALEEDK